MIEYAIIYSIKNQIVILPNLTQLLYMAMAIFKGEDEKGIILQ